MRDIKRIPRILERLRIIWEKNPDMRLGQLIENVFPNTHNDYISAYFEEDKEFIETLEQFYNQNRIFRRFGKKRGCK